MHRHTEKGVFDWMINAVHRQQFRNSIRCRFVSFDAFESMSQLKILIYPVLIDIFPTEIRTLNHKHKLIHRDAHTRQLIIKGTHKLQRNKQIACGTKIVI